MHLLVMNHNMTIKLKVKRGDYATSVSNKNVWHQINTKKSLSDPSILLLDKLGDAIIWLPKKYDNNKFNKIKKVYE